jgi:hypothetical protein
LEFFCYKVFANKRKNALYYTTGEELWRGCEEGKGEEEKGGGARQKRRGTLKTCPGACEKRPRRIIFVFEDSRVEGPSLQTAVKRPCLHLYPMF